MMIQTTTTTRTPTPTPTTACCCCCGLRGRVVAYVLLLLVFITHRNTTTNQQKLIKGANASSPPPRATKTIPGNLNAKKKSLSKATKVTENQLKEMSNLQAKCFFTPILGPNSPLDQLSMFYSKATWTKLYSKSLDT